MFNVNPTTLSLSHILDIAFHVSLSQEGRALVLVWHTPEYTRSIAITYLITDHDLNRFLVRDRLADPGSHGVAHTPLFATACRGPCQPNSDYIPDHRSRS